MAAPKKKTSALSEKPEPKTGPLTNLSDDHTSIVIEKYKGFIPFGITAISRIRTEI